ncbi:aspartyl-phosphate phosphatase Spo0E family protein [Paucisalibacillus sp. EB02]|uniref:aspartyl-phosphate phosphatase Spo0E family protein n=1 Tax=Paucisalibacillus sp. EB02 TaxID=1347087 RepID=UPI0004AD6844|nr:aspartyl-phosphate phosphatase Spo0E family protein [Paucisalibacillus sp. EB02]
MKNTKKELQNMIDKKQATMLDEAKKYGIHSKEVLERSEELDVLIIEYMKKPK